MITSKKNHRPCREHRVGILHTRWIMDDSSLFLPPLVHEVGHRLGSSIAERERTVLPLSDPGSLPERATLVRQGDPDFLGKARWKKKERRRSAERSYGLVQIL
ncbi:hypothetical protein BDL97_05G081500 [Sphagnum fallax]|nr:hypothetical protein BDL97_05G081500 [Sphagnum fallax]